MNNRWWLVTVGSVVAGIITLACLRPTAMLAPGKLSAGHQTLGEDCFACHHPGRGATAERCQTCHQLAEIGLRDTQHRPLPADANRVAFHQHLVEKSCLACHTGHAGSLAALPKKTFTHSLLEAHVGTRCNTCHQAPRDGIHDGYQEQCSSCHQQRAWHPATFDHTRWFPLTGHHAARCDTCHEQTRAVADNIVRRDFTVYTCYGCHEHRPSRIRAEHAEEGIRNLNDCVRCHRNGRENDEGREGGEDD